MNRKLNKLDVFMMLICGIMFADTIASNTSAGIPSVTWWIILGIFYMIPNGLIIGELTSMYPKQGGIYIWIKEGIGDHAASLSTWLFFVCGLFIPVSSFLMCADIICSLFFPDAIYQIRIIMAIIFLWIMVVISTFPLSESKYLINIAGFIKIAIYAGVFAAGIFYVATGNAVANDVNIGTLIPRFGEGLTYLPIILYCCTGMELASASAEDARNPDKAIPAVILMMSMIAVVLNCIASFGTLLIMPLQELNVSTGMMDVFMKIISNSVIYRVIGILFLFTVFAQCVVWLIGALRGTCESAKDGNLPKLLGKENRAGMPIGAIIVNGVMGTVLLILYAFLVESASDLYFALLSCGVIGTLIPYVLMMAAYQKLKLGKMKKHKGFSVPGGLLLSCICQALQVCTLVLMIYVPGYGWSDDVLSNGAGALLMILSGEIWYYILRGHIAEGFKFYNRED